jgi:hypothetical protein
LKTLGSQKTGGRLQEGFIVFDDEEFFLHGLGKISINVEPVPISLLTRTSP